jgi:hypothetical protein
MKELSKILILIVILIIIISMTGNNTKSNPESNPESQIESQIESNPESQIEYNPESQIESRLKSQSEVETRTESIVKIQENFSQFKKFSATSPYADVVFMGNDSVMYINVKYKKLSGVSALHIHVNNKGSPGPVLAWLGTTIQWQRGVAQTAHGANSPCCTKTNPMCILASPPNIGTPYLSSQLENTEKTFVFYNEFVGIGCPWINNGTLLDIHGFNFQENIDGKLTDKKPGPDIIFQSEFLQI